MPAKFHPRFREGARKEQETRGQRAEWFIEHDALLVSCSVRASVLESAPAWLWLAGSGIRGELGEGPASVFSDQGVGALEMAAD